MSTTTGPAPQYLQDFGSLTAPGHNNPSFDDVPGGKRRFGLRRGDHPMGLGAGHRPRRRSCTGRYPHAAGDSEHSGGHGSNRYELTTPELCRRPNLLTPPSDRRSLPRQLRARSPRFVSHCHRHRDRLWWRCSRGCRGVARWRDHLAPGNRTDLFQLHRSRYRHRRIRSHGPSHRRFRQYSKPRRSRAGHIELPVQHLRSGGPGDPGRQRFQCGHSRNEIHQFRRRLHHRPEILQGLGQLLALTSGRCTRADGTVLSTVTFTNESRSGGKLRCLPSAVPITAGATYVAAYVAPNGRYSADSQYFAYSGKTSSVLTALGSLREQQRRLHYRYRDARRQLPADQLFRRRAVFSVRHHAYHCTSTTPLSGSTSVPTYHRRLRRPTHVRRSRVRSPSP